jgi:hypothetical protein
MSAQESTIELMPQEDWEKTSFGKILKWALTVGRYIVSFTELIVIICFISRFSLDKNLSDLHDDVKQKAAIVKAASGFENDFRFVQTRLENINKIENGQAGIGNIISRLSQILPVNIYLTSIKVDRNKFSVSASATNESDMAFFVSKLKESGQFKNITLSSINFSISEQTRRSEINFVLGGEMINK